MPRPSLQEEIAGYPADVQDLILEIEAKEVARDSFYLRYTHSSRHEGGHVSHYGKADDGAEVAFGDTPAGYFFGLSYAAWLVVPRVSLQEMPLDWQVKFFNLLREAHDFYGLAVPEGLCVMRRGDRNRWISNEHWNDYRRGNTAQAIAVDANLGLRKFEGRQRREDHIS